MTFNDNARINTKNVSKRSGGRGRTGLKLGGSSLLVIGLLFLGSNLLGINLMPFADVANDVINQQTSQSSSQLEACATGADANTNDECRMAGAADSLDQYWETQLDDYRSPSLVLFDGHTQTQCGSASAQTGPFYCPPEEGIYVDTDFFAMLSTEYGASTGSLAQMYVLAHEWGHHMSKLLGQLDLANADRSTGAASGSVRLELQADCFAGAWVQNASKAHDDAGVPLLKPVTQTELSDALSAAAAVGDDNLMESAGMQVNPDRFTHGTSEQRQKWFETGYQEGPTSCATFDVPAAQL